MHFQIYWIIDLLGKLTQECYIERLEKKYDIKKQNKDIF